MSRRSLVLLAVLAGLSLLVIAGIYFAEPARSLPAFFPGHVGSGSATAGHHHVKHGIAALVLALACFAFAWFQTGPAGQATATDRGGPA